MVQEQNLQEGQEKMEQQRKLAEIQKRLVQRKKIAEIQERMEERKIMYNTRNILMIISCVVSLLVIRLLVSKKAKENNVV